MMAIIPAAAVVSIEVNMNATSVVMMQSHTLYWSAAYELLAYIKALVPTMDIMRPAAIAA